jgi:hypothetical protein
MDLAFLETKGRPRSTLTFAQVERELTVADLAQAPEGEERKPLKRLSSRHHTLARLIASGTPHVEAALIVNYTPQNVHILTTDPTFQELVEFYRKDLDTEYRNLHEQMAGLAVDAAAELRARLEDEEQRKRLSPKFLLDVVAATADRTGHGPSSTNVQANVFVDMASRVKEARETAARAMNARVIEGKVA